MLINPLSYFEELQDPRRETRNKLHPLQSIVFIVLCSTICGCDDWVSMEDFAIENEEWFSSHVNLPNGIPSHDTLSDVIGRLDKTAFATTFSAWMTDTLPHLKNEHFAIDGKMIGGGFGDENAIHLVTAFATKARMVFAMTQVDKKSNEIKTIPELIKLIDFKGSVVSGDAMYCQKDIAKQFIKVGADYVFALKENHKTLYDDVALWFDSSTKGHSYETVEKNHGRIETRKYGLCCDINWLDSRHEWQGLKGIGVVESTREIKGKVSIEKRYYLTTLEDLTYFAKIVRNHWCIENNQHWVLDVQFSEDANKNYINNQRHNLALIRRVALNMLKANDEGKLSIKRRRARALMNFDYRKQVVFGKT